MSQRSPRRSRRKKRGGESLALPFDHLDSGAAPFPPRPTEDDDSPLVEKAGHSTGEPESGWGQLSLWAESTPPPVAFADDSPATENPPPMAVSPPPPAKDPEAAGRVKPRDAPPPPKPAKREAPSPSGRAAALDEGSVEAAAEALGLDLDELREAARERELRPFWSYLRSQASRRVQMLREKTARDPFEWEGAALASVPAFVENRAAVELLYRNLRGEEELTLF